MVSYTINNISLEYVNKSIYTSILKHDTTKAIGSVTVNLHAFLTATSGYHHASAALPLGESCARAWCYLI
jgi:hypothetical protein